MKRRNALAIVVIGAALLGAPLAACAQQSSKIHRIGILTLGVAPSSSTFDGFRQGLREHGYVEGRNVVLEFQFAQGATGKLAVQAAELVRLKVDLIVTESTPAALAAKQASQTIPIVMAMVGDPVKAGLVASLSRPGGNITGVTALSSELSGKRLQLLKDIAPRTTLVAVIWNPSNPVAHGTLQDTKAAAAALGLQLQPFEARNPADLEEVFKAVSNARPSALITLADGMLLEKAERIVEFTAKNRLPAVFPDGEAALVGGLMSYGPNLASNFRRAAAIADKILKGAKPADLPVEQPAQFELVVNLRTARQLGVRIPPELLARADRVIE